MEKVLFKVELDKTAEEFRKIHVERQDLLRQWENTIEQMQKRDRDMDQLALVSIFISIFICGAVCLKGRLQFLTIFTLKHFAGPRV